MNFYTDCQRRNNRILLRGYQNGKRYRQQVEYQPRLFVPTKSESKFRTITGAPVEERRFDSPNDMQEYQQRYKDVEGFTFYGLELPQYQYLYENFRNCEYDSNQIVTNILDIETDTTDGYPDIDLADKKITAITMLYRDITFVLGYNDFQTDDSTIKYIKCSDEYDLLEKFLTIWSSDRYCPDVVSGWNIEFFDIPYIINRITRLFNPEKARKLSPWGKLEHRTISSFGKKITIFFPVGIAVLDYLQLYRKFTFEPQETYRLDAIAEYELGERKLDYSDYGSLHKLYNEDHQKFIEYNIRDCQLVKRIDEKRNLLALVYTIAYDAGVNFVDALTTVRSWDIAIHNYLMDRFTVIPRNDVSRGDIGHLEGGYVKAPLVGRHNWVVSFDLASLYPHLIMQYNIGPETFVKRLPESFSTEDIIAGKHKSYDPWLEENNYCLTGSSAVYHKNKQSFLSALMKEMFAKRSEVKKEMLVLKQKNDKTLENEISRLDTLQTALKIRLNSLYGSLANPYSRWFDIRNAEAITLSGQLTVKWAEHYFNVIMNKLLKTTNTDYVIAVDTDSVYINMEEVVRNKNNKLEYLDKFCETRVQPFLDKIFDNLQETMHGREQAMYMKREAIADRGVFVAKKRYMLNVLNNEGVQYEKPQLKIMGLESVRSSTPSACRAAIKETIRLILQAEESDVHDFIEDFRAKFEALPFEQIAKNSTVNGLDKYGDSTSIYKKGTPIHVRGALLYNKIRIDAELEKDLEPIFEGGKIKFCYLKTPNPLQENVISVPNKLPAIFGLDTYIDRELQFSKTYLEPCRSILACVGWTSEPINTLSNFWE
jgi:DNA polymerase elongation subunit (family B)